MPSVDIYTTPFCPFCIRAKHLLKKKGVDFSEIDIWLAAGRRAEMLERAHGRSTVPQIFIDGRGIGGCDELLALEASGELDAMLASGAPVGVVNGAAPGAAE